MAHYRYLIVGGGMAADAAAQAIREIDGSNPLAILGDEPHAPYNRPPLSKGLWKGEPLGTVDRGTARRDVVLLLGRRAVALDTGARLVVDDEREVHGYDELLIATGGRPRRLDFGGGDILYYRTVDDYERLRQLADHCEQFLVLGAGFIASELAAALAMNGKLVTLLFPGDAIGQRLFPRDLADRLVQLFRDHGVEVVPRDVATQIFGGGERLVVHTAGGRLFDPDAIVAGVGIEPNVELAQSGALAVDDGILVDEFLRTSAPHVYAAGDVANFPSLLGRRRVEHEDAALSMGRTAGRAMAGAPEPYRHLPMFYSDLFDFGYEAVGEIDARLETRATWNRPFREGSVYYLRDGRVRGVLLVNTFGRIDAARRLIERSNAGAPLEEPLTL